MIDAALVAAAHDAMEEEYDQIDDLWYAHLFNAIHAFLLRHAPAGENRTALDVGCGTGFQSLLLARAGYRAKGFDIAQGLVEVARSKLGSEREAGSLPWPLYQTSLPGFMDEQRQIVAAADRMRSGRAFQAPEFLVGDALDPAAYQPGGYSVIVCFGSVLSFIDDHDRVLGLMSHALAPGGMLFLEVEQRVNLDLLWAVADRLAFGALGYEQTWKECLGNLVAPPGRNLRIDYPFMLKDGTEIGLPIWLFSIGHLERAFRQCGMRVIGRRAAHAITNLIPSTVLHRQRPARGLVSLFRRLASVERATAGVWPVWRLGCSVVYCLMKGSSS